MLAKACGVRLPLTVLQSTTEIHRAAPQFLRRAAEEEKSFTLLVTSSFFALSSHPVLNNGQIWKPESYKVYLLRTGEKKKKIDFFVLGEL